VVLPVGKSCLENNGLGIKKPQGTKGRRNKVSVEDRDRGGRREGSLIKSFDLNNENKSSKGRAKSVPEGKEGGGMPRSYDSKSGKIPEGKGPTADYKGIGGGEAGNRLQRGGRRESVLQGKSETKKAGHAGKKSRGGGQETKWAIGERAETRGK